MLLDVIPEVAYDNVMTDAPQRPDFQLLWPAQVYYLITTCTLTAKQNFVQSLYINRDLNDANENGT